MQVGGIIGKGGLTPMWYIRFGVVAGGDWAKKRKTEPRGLGLGSRGLGREWLGDVGWGGVVGVCGVGDTRGKMRKKKKKKKKKGGGRVRTSSSSPCPSSPCPSS